MSAPLSALTVVHSGGFDKPSGVGRTELGPREGRRSPGRILLPALALLLSLLLPEVRLLPLGGAAPAGAQQQPPHLAWFTFDTSHFQVVFHEGLESVARRAAERAERALEKLSGFGTLPPLPIQLVISDHTDLSNGFAGVVPYPRVAIWARPPLDGPGAIPFDEWLEVVVTHEIVHILHLEMTGTLGSVARRVFGRPPLPWPTFPSFTLSRWAIEGVAVHGESAHTDGGRIHTNRPEAVMRAAALDGSLERLDQVRGSSPVWPGGERPYLYGSQFHQWLAEEYGAPALGEYFQRVAERLNPYRIDASARDVFGESLQSLYARWMERVEEEAREVEEEIRNRALAPEPALLTRDERFALYAVHDPRGGRLAYTRVDGRSEPALVIRDQRGAGPGEELHHLHLLSPPSWGPDGSLWITQTEFRDRYTIHGELWRVDPEGRKERLTRGARLAAADMHPAGDRLVAVQEVAGTNRLVLLDPEGAPLGELTAADASVHWAHPRWSPDGTELAVVRWRAGGWWGLVRLDPQGTLLQVVEEGRAPLTGPAWTPDGRAILWSSERSGIRNLYAATREEEGASPPEGGHASAAPDPASPIVAAPPLMGAPRQVTDVVTAASFPSVSPEGGEVVFSLLTSTGWELARIPWDPGEGFAPLPLDPHFQDPGSGAMEEGHRVEWPGEVRPWSPLPTLRPRFWQPLWVEPDELAGVRVLPWAVGVGSTATDAVGRFGWSGFLLAPVGSPGRRWEMGGTASWAGLGDPVLSLSAEQSWNALGRLRFGEGPEERDLFALARDRSTGVVASSSFPGFRRSVGVSLGLRGLRQDRFLMEADGRDVEGVRLARPRRDLAEISGTVGVSTVRSYPFSVSAQEGAGLTLRLRGRRDLSVGDTLRGVAGADGAFQEAVGVGRFFLPLPTPGYAPAVLALRGAGGVAGGPGPGSGHFLVGGGLFPVRGFLSGVVGGDRAWGASGEIRFPLAILHRGWRSAPLHLDRLAGSLFMDAGGARWSAAPEGSPAEEHRWVASAGGEVVLRYTLLNGLPSIVRWGLSFPLEGGTGARSHAGLGWAF